jgi:hypothetical protein
MRQCGRDTIVNVVIAVVIWGGISWGVYAGGRGLWNAYAARQTRLAEEAARKAAFDAVFKPCFELLWKKHNDERREALEERQRMMDNIRNPHAYERQKLLERVADSYMEERHHDEYRECMKEKREKQKRVKEVAR